MQHLQPNTTLQGGKYRIERLLGQGGFGNTYMAKNTVFDDYVAIKEFFMQGVNDRDENSGSITIGIESNTQQFEEQREKFKKEARRLWKLKNEHIVKVHDLFEENGTAYYVMDFIDGESLAEKLKKMGHPFSESEVRGFISQILDALKVVHQNDIWHLDLKPGNIMMDKSGNVYLIDFGASKQIRANGSMTTSTALCYTPGYAPNEQIGQMYDRFGPWTDIYALGATVYNLLTNKKPPMVIDIEEDGEKAFNFPLYISEEMRKLVVWMMQPKRKARPQSVAEIISKMSNSKQSVQKAEYNDEETIISRGFSTNSEETILIGCETNKCPVGHAVDLGLSVLWADFNLGGTTSNPKGVLFGWGDVSGQKKSLDVADYVPLRKYVSHQIEGDMGATEYDIATFQWGSKWRMPNRKHWEELINKCQWFMEKHDNIMGYRVVGLNGKEIFLPVTGVRFENRISYPDYGYYWTSELAEDDRSSAYSYNFSLESENRGISSNHVYIGKAVRPICEE